MGFFTVSFRRKGFQQKFRSVSKQDFCGQNVIHGFAIQDTFGSGGIVSHHAAHVCPAGGGGIGGEMQAVFGKLLIQLIPDKARLHPDPFFPDIHFQDFVHVFGKIQDQGLCHRLARQACAATPWKDFYLVVSGNFNGIFHISLIQWQYHGQGVDLVDAGIGGVHAQ